MTSPSAAVQAPHLIPEWSPRNEKALSDYSSGSGVKAWWIGPCGHEWKTEIRGRVSRGSGCPYCRKGGFREPSRGVRESFAQRYPNLVREWHPDNPLQPEDVSHGSKKKVRWVGACGHEWVSSVLNRRNGWGCPHCPPRVSARDVAPHLALEWDPSNKGSLSSYKPQSAYLASWTCPQGHSWTARIYDRVRRTGCPTCSGSGRSALEGELQEFVRTYFPGAVSNDRETLRGRELDISVPSAGIAIEFNGVYWHSEKYRTPDYHQVKSERCEEAGLQLVHVWEDDWIERRGIVERMILRKLGASQEVRLNARSLSRVRVSASEARVFLEENHLQGFASGREYLALNDDEGIRALLVMKNRGDGSWELSRFASNAIVRGGHSRLFKWFLKEHPEVSRVVTFADRGVSDGGLYRASGFREDATLAPDYMYVVRGRRFHKFNYRVSRFRDDPNLKFREGMSERELAALNEIPRIWDAGKIRYVYER